MSHNPQTNFGDVGDFHTKFGLPVSSNRPLHPSPELLEFRRKFMHEELEEFEEGLTEADHEKMFDALIDLVYVAMGTAHLLGYPWQRGWNLVQQANMSKVRAQKDGSDSARGSSFDVVKPEGWVAPDIGGLLGECGWGIVSPHKFEAFDGASGMVCTAMVLRGGHGEDCGLPATDLAHHKEPKR